MPCYPTYVQTRCGGHHTGSQHLAWYWKGPWRPPWPVRAMTPDAYSWRRPLETSAELPRRVLQAQHPSSASPQQGTAALWPCQSWLGNSLQCWPGGSLLGMAPCAHPTLRHHRWQLGS